MTLRAPLARRAARPAASVAAGTVASRATGLGRTVTLAVVLGVTPLAGAVGVASVLPIVLLVLVTGGTLTATLVPLLAQEPHAAERAAVAQSLSRVVLVATSLAALAAMASAPVLGRVYATGMPGDAVAARDFAFAVAVLTVLFAPQIIGYGMGVVAAAVLNAEGRFALPAASPVLTNVVATAAIAAYALTRPPATGNTSAARDWSIVLLGGGMTVGVLLAAWVQLRAARRALAGWSPWGRPRWDPATRQVMRLGSWTFVYVVSNQIGLLVVTLASSSVASGAGTAAYQWAFAIMQLPYAVVGASILTAVFPRMSRTPAGPEMTALLTRSAHAATALLVPCAVALGVAAPGVVSLLLQYGAVDDAGGRAIAAALTGFSAALVPFAVYQLLTRASYASRDTRRPALVNVGVNAVNIIGAVVTMRLAVDPTSSLLGLGLSYAASYVFGGVVLAVLLRSSVPGLLPQLGTALGSTAGLALVSLPVSMLASAAMVDAVGASGATARLLQVVMTGLVVVTVHGRLALRAVRR